MLKLVPKHWFSWDFTLSDATGMASAEIILSSWRERGAVVAVGKQYKVSRQGLVGPFVVEENGTELASAVKLSAFSQEFTVCRAGQQYTLKPIAWWGREFGVFVGERRVGSIAPEAWFARRADVELPEEMPMWLRAFVVWLTLLMWKREAETE